MESSVKQVLYPYMRLDLREYANSLRDQAHQKRVWIEQKPSQKQDSFTDVVHFFYDDTPLARDPEKCVGFFLRDASEVAAVKALTSAVDALFMEFGTEQPDEAYIRAPKWAQVVSRAEVLVTLLDRPENATGAVR